MSPDSPLVTRVAAACNYGERRDGAVADMLVLHYTGMACAEKAVAWLTCEESQVSCHYLVDLDGAIVQMVREQDRAWHAGVSCWRGVSDINSCSIGIEVHNPGSSGGYADFPDVQMAAVEALCVDIVRRHGIVPERVLAHSDVAPLRKDDPGEKFDWHRLWRAGVGHWVGAEPLGCDAGLAADDSGPRVATVQAALCAYGYGVAPTGCYDAATAAAVTAFQRHWRPQRVDGRMDSSTWITLARLARSIPSQALTV